MLVYQVNRRRLNVSLEEGQVSDDDKQLVSSFSVHRDLIHALQYSLHFLPF